VVAGVARGGEEVKEQRMRTFWFKPLHKGNEYLVAVEVSGPTQKQTRKRLGHLTMSRSEWEGLRGVLWWANMQFDKRGKLNEVRIDQRGWR